MDFQTETTLGSAGKQVAQTDGDGGGDNGGSRSDSGSDGDGSSETGRGT